MMSVNQSATSCRRDRRSPVGDRGSDRPGDALAERHGDGGPSVSAPTVGMLDESAARSAEQQRPSPSGARLHRGQQPSRSSSTQPRQVASVTAWICRRRVVVRASSARRRPVPRCPGRQPPHRRSPHRHSPDRCRSRPRSSRWSRRGVRSSYARPSRPRRSSANVSAAARPPDTGRRRDVARPTRRPRPRLPTGSSDRRTPPGLLARAFAIVTAPVASATITPFGICCRIWRIVFRSDAEYDASSSIDQVRLRRILPGRILRGEGVGHDQAQVMSTATATRSSVRAGRGAERPDLAQGDDEAGGHGRPARAEPSDERRSHGRDQERDPGEPVEDREVRGQPARRSRKHHAEHETEHAPPFAGDARSAADGRPAGRCFLGSLHRSRGGQDTHGVPEGIRSPRYGTDPGRAIGTPPDRSRVGIVGPATAHRPMPWRAAWMKRRRPTDP